uniref:Uncharacterized protein n=1 Tax=viral metagenome TaxID=1070528 RepID=A0A6M3LZ68_9ZZZZ
MRHSWEKDKPRKGYSTCSNCALEVKNYKIKKGSLALCEPKKPDTSPKIACDDHETAATAGALGCWSCGQLYTPEEREAGRLRMEETVKIKLKEITEDTDTSKNPPPELYKPNKPKTNPSTIKKPKTTTVTQNTIHGT